MYRTVEVEIDVSEVLAELSTEELQKELMRREDSNCGFDAKEILERAYRDLRGKCQSDALRDYFYAVLGKIA